MAREALSREADADVPMHDEDSRPQLRAVDSTIQNGPAEPQFEAVRVANWIASPPLARMSLKHWRRNVPDRNSSLSATAQKASPLPETALVEAARAGSAAAFTELQSLYSRSLYNTIMRITKHREDTEDALQNTFLQAYRSLPNFEGRSTLYSWLTRIGINSALTIIRKRRVGPEGNIAPPPLSDDSTHFEIKDSAPNPEEICDQRQRYGHMLNAIESLDPSLRTAILLQLTRGYSLREIAQELQISEAATKARLHRARRRLSSSFLADRMSYKRVHRTKPSKPDTPAS
jgi:RNA polymerase sigma-70 factor, ECF subfamily